MDTETSPFETSEILATFLASTPLLSESWKLCHIANTTAPQSFVTEQIGNIGYVAFSAVHMVSSGSEPSRRKLVALDNNSTNGLFSPLYRHNEGEEPVMVHAGMLSLFLSIYRCPDFQRQMVAIMEKSKSIVITGHSMGGTTASLTALWLLFYLRSISSQFQVICITFGSPLLGNESLSQAILHERWGTNFCHVVSKHDIMPRLLFAPIPPLIPQIDILLHWWHLSIIKSSSNLVNLTAELTDENKAEIFRVVLGYMQLLVQAREGLMRSVFWPFGSYLFCSEQGAICMDNATSVIKMMHLMLIIASPDSSIDDHLKYGEYVGQVSLQFLKNRSFLGDDHLPESSYDAGVALALESAGIANQELVSRQVKECLKMARRMGHTPSLNCANLAIKLSKITPYRAEIEWYKAKTDASDEQMGYYDSFKRREISKRDSKINMNRIILGKFWDRVIQMLENNQLPHDFHMRGKWVNASQFYKLLSEPLDIAEYYRTRMHKVKGHYVKHGRERRYEIFDRWWRKRHSSNEEETNRSRFASLTQDTCFWAKLEEARDWTDNIRSENDTRKRAFLWENIIQFESYATGLVERKEVSIDVLARNSSYSQWVEEWKELKSQVWQFPHIFPPSFVDGEVAP